MNNPKICIICAVAKNRAIGKDNKLLWNIPADLKHFKEKTSGHPIIMGQKTFESIGRPLPNRTNIILSKDENFKPDDCVVCDSLDLAIDKAKEIEDNEIFIIGGGSVYAQTIGMADKLYLTVVDGDFEADTFFPDYSDFKKIIFESPLQKDGEFSYKFLELERE